MSDNQMTDSAKHAIGMFPLYPPVELAESFNVCPRLMWGLDRDIQVAPRADQHVQVYACSVARRLTEYVLTEGENLSGLFAYNACDTLRNLPEILADPSMMSFPYTSIT